MRKTFRTVGAFALCAVLLPVFASCGDDDDNVPGDGPDIPAISDDGPSGEVSYLRVSSVGNYRIYYDEKGRVQGVGSGLYIDYSNGKFEVEDEVANVKFNGKGYISEISGSWNYEDEYGSYKGNGKMTFSYNGSGNLVKYVTSSKETEYSDGMKYNYDESFTTECKWTGGNMVRATCEGYERDEEGTDRWSEQYVFEYDQEKNRYYQMPLSVSSVLDVNDEWLALAAAGLLGRGPANLPSTCANVDEDGEVDSYIINFRLNDNGSIAREIINNSSIDWGYDEYTRGMFDEQPVKKHMVRSLFKRGGDRR